MVDRGEGRTHLHMGPVEPHPSYVIGGPMDEQGFVAQLPAKAPFGTTSRNFVRDCPPTASGTGNRAISGTPGSSRRGASMRVGGP